MSKPRTIIAVGGGLGLDSKDSGAFNKWLVKHTGVDQPKALYIPTAGAENPEKILQFIYSANEAGCSADWLSLFDQTSSDLREYVLSHDIIFVGGGNTANMLAIWQEHELGSILKEAYERGIVLSGKSAGALCWFEGGLTDSYGPELRPIKKGLGLLKGSYVPHFNDGDFKRKALYEKAVRDGKLPEGIGAPDGVTIVYENEEMKEIVSINAELSAKRVSREKLEAENEQIKPTLVMDPAENVGGEVSEFKRGMLR